MSEIINLQKIKNKNMYRELIHTEIETLLDLVSEMNDSHILDAQIQSLMNTNKHLFATVKLMKYGKCSKEELEYLKQLKRDGYLYLYKTKEGNLLAGKEFILKEDDWYYPLDIPKDYEPALLPPELFKMVSSEDEMPLYIEALLNIN